MTDAPDFGAQARAFWLTHGLLITGFRPPCFPAEQCFVLGNFGHEGCECKAAISALVGFASAVYAAGQQAALAWRPIEEAPRDGTEIFGAYKHAGRWCYRIVRARTVTGDVEWLTEPSRWQCKPTHWFLPAPPAQETTK